MKRTLALLMKKCQFPLLGNELMIYILNDAMNMILRARASLSFFECFQLSSNAMHSLLRLELNPNISPLRKMV